MTDPNQINRLRLSLPINHDIFTGESYEFGISGREPYSYGWIFYFSCVAAFICAASSGSNDVANSFATSVGSRSLKMWQAVVAASICEFSGAMLLGQRTIDTIRSNIVTPATFFNKEDLLMFGMMCAILWVGIFQFFASYHEINISTTHSIIGSIIGFALCTPAGSGAINWGEVGRIVGSWFASPALAAAISSTLYLGTRTFILRANNAADRALIFFPLLAFFTVALNAFFVMYNGGITTGRGLSRVNLPVNETVGWAVLFGFIAALIVQFLLNPYLRRKIGRYTDEQLEYIMGVKEVYGTTKDFKSAAQVAENGEVADTHAIMDGKADGNTSVTDSFTMPETPWWEKKLDYVFRQDSIHGSLMSDDKISAMHNKAEKFHIRTEFIFGYLQILTACFASFAHGAGDVANYIGPLAAIYAAYYGGAGSARNRNPVPDWLIALGAAGIVFGLATYGQKVIAAFGVKTVRITPARGYAVELAAAIVIITAAFLGIPISTSHSFVGAIVGVGLCEGTVQGSVNWHIVFKNVAWWFSTLFICGSVVAVLFSWATFAPSQILPLSKDNCMAFYATLYNATNGDPNSFLIQARDGTLQGLYGWPSTGQVFSF